jgi:hypothetical protein
MQAWPWPIPNPNWINDDLPQAAQDYLKGLGFDVQGVSLQTNPPVLVTVSDQDPTDALNAYTGQPSAGRNKLLQARDIALAYRDKVLANQAVTAAETAKALAAAITLIERLARMD